MAINNTTHVGTPWPSGSWVSISSHEEEAVQSAPDSWVKIPKMQRCHNHRKPQQPLPVQYNCLNRVSPAAVSKPIDIPGRQMPLSIPYFNSPLPKNHNSRDHKVHCYQDDVTDYCRRDSNGWEPMRQKRRESIESQVGKILDGSWELVTYGRTQNGQKKDHPVQGDEVDEIERYLNGETDLLGYLEDARKEMDDDEEQQNVGY